MLIDAYDYLHMFLNLAITPMFNLENQVFPPLGQWAEGEDLYKLFCQCLKVLILPRQDHSHNVYGFLEGLFLIY